MRRLLPSLVLSGASLFLLSQAALADRSIVGGDRLNARSPNVLSAERASVAGRILCAWADNDAPGYRAAISAAAGGATVDYFDASAGTPTAAQLAAYDCVYTHPNFAYADRVLLGNRLADFVDAGGKVILGVFCAIPEAQFAGTALSGRIMTPGYCPVVATGNSILFAGSPYAGNGTTCVHYGVTAYDNQFRDVLGLQGNGRQDGSYADGNISLAYRPLSVLLGAGLAVLGLALTALLLAAPGWLRGRAGSASMGPTEEERT